MDKLEKTESQLANITVNVDLVKALYHVNYLVSFPISDLMLEGWSKSITELRPEITPSTVKWIVDHMKLGIIEYKSKMGIQNIFQGFSVYLNHEIKKKNDQIKILRPDYFSSCTPETESKIKEIEKEIADLRKLKPQELKKLQGFY